MVTIAWPYNGQVFYAPVCPFSPDNCLAVAAHTVIVDAAGPIDAVFVEYYRDGALYLRVPVCQDAPPGSFEWPTHLECPDPGQPWDFSFAFNPGLPSGSWTSRVTVTDKLARTTAPVDVNFLVVPPSQTRPAAMKPVEITPNRGQPGLKLRQAPDTVLPGEKVEILGRNLHNNPFLKVYLTPIPDVDPVWSPEAGFPTIDWCKYEATIVERNTVTMAHSSCPGSTPGAPQTCAVSRLEIQLPEVPAMVQKSCAPGVTARYRPLDINWRIAIYDPWGRPERVHDWEAVPDPYLAHSLRQPPFRLGVTDFPKVFGFGFPNEDAWHGMTEFLAIYRDNAYLPYTSIPDPIYFGLYAPAFIAVMNLIDGTCNGIAATSQLIGRGEQSASDWDPDVFYPGGFDTHGPATWDGVLRPTPTSLWAEIKKNHGVQTSHEFLDVILQQITEDFPNTSPTARLAQLANGATGFVMCGGGHCVTPYAVVGNDILTYDNNCPGVTTKWTVNPVDDTYTDECSGNGPRRDLFTIPLHVWQGEHHAGSLHTALGLLYAIAFGSVDALYRNPTGAYGHVPGSNALIHTMADARQLPLFGAVAAPVRDRGPVLLPASGALEVDAVARGGDYTLFFSGTDVAYGNELIYKLDVRGVAAGTQDRFRIGNDADAPHSVVFVSTTSGAQYEPSVGLELGDRARGVFTVTGAVGVGEVELTPLPARRGIAYHNRTSTAGDFTVIIDAADGVSGQYGRRSFGPFHVPAGEKLTVWLGAWPAQDQVSWTID